MMKFWSICHNTFIQTIRQPLFGILVLITFGVLVLELPLSGWTMEIDYRASDQKMLETLGLSTLLVSGLLLASFSASSVLAREIEDRTALTVISKPVSRTTFVLGKFAGVSAAITVGFYLCGLVFLMTVRHRVMSAASDPYDVPVLTLGLLALGLTLAVGILGNVIFGWHFSSSTIWTGLVLLSLAMAILSFVGKGWQIVPLGYDTLPTAQHNKPAISAELLKQILLIFMAVMIFCGVAIAASTRLGQIMTLMICFGIFLLGSLQPAFGSMAQDIPAFHLLKWISPNLTYFYGMESIYTDKPVPMVLLGQFALYALCYLGAVLSIGIALFQTRELESQASSSSMPALVGMVAWAGRAAGLGAIVIGMVSISLLWLPEIDKTGTAMLAGLWIVIGVAAWMFWGYFSRGAKWAYWLVLGTSVLGLPALLIGYLVPASRLVIEQRSLGTICLAAIVVLALVLGILVLPKSRYHFEIRGRSSKKSIASSSNG